jgi:hypothetical protein
MSQLTENSSQVISSRLILERKWMVTMLIALELQLWESRQIGSQNCILLLLQRRKLAETQSNQAFNLLMWKRQ